MMACDGVLGRSNPWTDLSTSIARRSGAQRIPGRCRHLAAACVTERRAQDSVRRSMRLHAFLFDQLWNEGVRHIFGIPGDFVLNLYEALEDDGRFQLVRLSHEPAVGFAADGAARITSGLGGVLRHIRGRRAQPDESGRVRLCRRIAADHHFGRAGPSEKRAAIPVHHEVKSFESQLKIYQEVTEYAAMLDDPLTAATHIPRRSRWRTRSGGRFTSRCRATWCLPTSPCPRSSSRCNCRTIEGAVDEAAEEIVRV